MAVPQEDPQAKELEFRSKVAELLSHKAVDKKGRILQLLAANIDLLDNLAAKIVDNLPPLIISLVSKTFHFDLEHDLVKVPFGMIAKCTPEQVEEFFPQVLAAVEDVAKYGTGESGSGS